MIMDNFLPVSPETKNIISCQKEEKRLFKEKIKELEIENKEVARLRILANNPWM